MNEFEEAMKQVLSEGNARIDALSDEELDGILNEQILAS